MKPSEIIETKDWSRGAYCRDATGAPFREPFFRLADVVASCCILGAMRMAFGNDPAAYGQAYARVHDKLISRGWNGGIIGWNDHEAKTKTEVLELLKECDL